MEAAWFKLDLYRDLFGQLLIIVCLRFSCCLLASESYRPNSNAVISGLVLQGQHDLLPLRLAFFRAYASSISLPTNMPARLDTRLVAGGYLDGITPASLCSIAKPQP